MKKNNIYNKTKHNLKSKTNTHQIIVYKSTDKIPYLFKQKLKDLFLKPDAIKELYTLEGKIHRSQYPAIFYKNGDKYWLVKDKLHRTDGPAIETNARQEWWINGLRHRDNDLPAIESNDGHKSWYQNGQLHRLNDAAIIHLGGLREWFYNGKSHRTDGPAIYYTNDNSKYTNGSYWVMGKPITIPDDIKNDEEKIKDYLQIVLNF